MFVKLLLKIAGSVFHDPLINDTIIIKSVRYNHNPLCKISDKGNRLGLGLIVVGVRVGSLVNGCCSIRVTGSFF